MQSVNIFTGNGCIMYSSFSALVALYLINFVQYLDKYERCKKNANDNFQQLCADAIGSMMQCNITNAPKIYGEQLKQTLNFSST